jgi:hypothetical protein
LFVVIDVGTWFCNTLMRLVLRIAEVSSYWSSKPMCRVIDVFLYLVGVVLLVSGG